MSETNSGPIRLLIVEDHQILTEALEVLLGDMPDVELVGRAGTVAESVRVARDAKPTVVLMDYRLPDGNGAEAAQEIRKTNPDVAVLFLSADDSQASLLNAVEAGACGYVLKSEKGDVVVDALRRAAKGEMLISAAVLAELLAMRRRQTEENAELKRLRDEITDREMEVLRLMAEGLDNHAIAAHLSIGFTTVRGHVQRVLEKLGAHSKLEAVARAAQHGLLA
jgi:DNA-binding NarL/FixJ family response regulator